MNNKIIKMVQSVLKEYFGDDFVSRGETNGVEAEGSKQHCECSECMKYRQNMKENDSDVDLTASYSGGTEPDQFNQINENKRGIDG